MFQKPHSSTGLRVLVIGHALSAGMIEKLLSRHSTTRYHCVDSMDAADWLIGEGFSPDVIIAHDRFLECHAQLDRWPGLAECRIVKVCTALRELERIKIDAALSGACLDAVRGNSSRSRDMTHSGSGAAEQMQVAA